MDASGTGTLFSLRVRQEALSTSAMSPGPEAGEGTKGIRAGEGSQGRGYTGDGGDLSKTPGRG